MKLIANLVSRLNKWSHNWLMNYTGLREDNRTRAKERYKEVNGFKVTEHAILRYFERVEGYDINKIREEITAGSLASQVKKGGSGKYVVGDLTIVVEGKYVLTVFKDDKWPSTENHIKGLEKLTRA